MDRQAIELAVPRDREASFGPQLIATHRRRFPGVDDKIISMHTRGMSTRAIVGHLHDHFLGAVGGHAASDMYRLVAHDPFLAEKVNAARATRSGLT